MAKGNRKIGSGDIQRFDQKNIMFRRVRWDPSMQELKQKWYGEHIARDRPGYTLKDRALEGAGWYVERQFAKGNHSGNFGLYIWEIDPNEVARINRLALGQRYPVSDRAQMSRDIKKAAKFLGASLVGICRLDRRWVYSHIFDPVTFEHSPFGIPEEFEYVIVIAVEMDYEVIKLSPALIAEATPADAYSRMAFVAGRLAHFIRGLGYKAMPSGNDSALNIPLAIDAGLGELGRHGILITEKFGPRVRLCKVFTDLPLIPDKPIEFGVTEFCNSCKRCAEDCPGRAISFGEPTNEGSTVSNNSGAYKWYIDPEKCFQFWVQNDAGGCNNCIRVCPFNKPTGWLHEVSRFIVRDASWIDPLLVRMDEFFGYGKRVKAESFWAD